MAKRVPVMEKKTGLTTLLQNTANFTKFSTNLYDQKQVGFSHHYNCTVYSYVTVPLRTGLSKRQRDDGTGDGTLHTYEWARASPERNYDDGAAEDYRIGTLSKINNIIYCKNDSLQSTT